MKLNRPAMPILMGTLLSSTSAYSILSHTYSVASFIPRPLPTWKGPEDEASTVARVRSHSPSIPPVKKYLKFTLSAIKPLELREEL